MSQLTAPAWDLNDLYSGPQDPQRLADLRKLKDDAETFRARFQGKLVSSTGAELLEAIQTYETLQTAMALLGSYAYLLFAEDMSNAENAALLQSTREQLTEANTPLVFFTLELNALTQAQLETCYNDAPKLEHYRHFLDVVRLYQGHQLSEELEQLDQDRDLTGASSWIRLYDETLARLEFPVGDKKLTLSEILNALLSPDGATREAAAHSMAATLKSQEPLFTTITNTLAQDKAISDRWRQYATPMDARHLDNQVEAEVVEALETAVENAYPRLSHRYYRLKAKWFGVEALPYWDRNAPLPGASKKIFTWEEAKAIVLNAYREFSPQMADIAELFFKNNWIDATLRPGKDSGAFSAHVSASLHPYILMNFHGTMLDVRTLAHELGHGIHQYLARRQGELLADTPLTVAETASVFGEMLTFKALLRQCTTPEEKRFMIAGKVEDMLNTVVRQIAFYRFEQDVHLARKNGELSAAEIGAFWMKRQHESLGDGITLAPEYSIYWAYVGHFIHTPFYVYAYAFGDCLVNTLYSLFEEGHPNFQEKYLGLLAAGGSKRYDALVAPLGLNPKDPAFWTKGLQTIEHLIDELEKL